MNKKFLSAILFGALMVSSTGTFVSCKDYDDDIDQINNTLNDLKSQIAALQTEVSNGNWVTSLTPTDGGFTVTFKDGKTYTIVNGKDGDKGETGEAGKDGNSVEVKDGYWYINGEKTDYVAVIKEDLGKALVPYVENGVWVFYDKDGNPVPSTYKAVGNAWAVKANGSWTLHIPDVEGNDQTIELPGAASVITGLEIKSKATGGSMAFELAKGNAFVYTSNDLIAKKDWKGTKEIPADGAFVYTSATKYDMRVNPVNVDAKELSYTLTNTKNGDIPNITLKATEQNEMFTTGSVNGRAAQGNGLYELSMDNFVLAKAQAEAFNVAYNEIPNNRAHAVNAEHAFRSAYSINKTAFVTAPVLSRVTAKNNEGTSTEWTLGTTKAAAEAVQAYTNKLVVDLNATTKVNAVEAAALYDMYIYVPEEYAASDVFNVTVDQAKQTFTVKRNPDASTLEAWFPMYVYTIDINGTVKVANIKVVLSSKIDHSAYELVEHNVSSNPNLFKIDLSTMYSNLGNDLNTWKINVKLANTEYKLYSKYENGALSGEINVNAAAFTEYVVKEVKASNSGNVSDINDAKFIQVKVDNANATYTGSDGNTYGLPLGTTYYLMAKFKNAADAELNTIVVPVKFVAPTVADQFAIRTGYVKDDAINAYFYFTDKATVAANKVVELTKYFSKFDKVAGVELGETKVGETNKKSSELAILVGDDKFETTTLQLDPAKKPNSQFEYGYGETLNVKVTNSNYKDTKWVYSKTSDTEYNFNIRLMSPIEQGSIKPVGASTITISGNDLVKGAQITDKMIMGYDYNDNGYNVVPDALPEDADVVGESWWANPQVVKVTPGQDDDKYIRDLDTKPATGKDGKVTANGYFVVKGESISQTVEVKMPVTVEDAWGYTKVEKVSVTIKKN